MGLLDIFSKKLKPKIFQDGYGYEDISLSNATGQVEKHLELIEVFIEQHPVTKLKSYHYFDFMKDNIEVARYNTNSKELIFFRTPILWRDRNNLVRVAEV